MKTVKEVCELLKITRKTLFYYDRIGLLKPTIRQGSQHHKLYGDKALKKLIIICIYRKAGYRIEDIRKLEETNTWDYVYERLQQQYQLLNKQEQYLKKLKDYTIQDFDSQSIKDLLVLFEEGDRNEID